MKADKNNTAIIMAATGGYSFEGFLSEGYKVFSSYRGSNNLILRILREICFRVFFFPKSIWYNKDILDFKPQYIIIRDSIITKNYLLWLIKMLPNTQINFLYENMVGKANHLFPSQIPDKVRVWTYDEYDSSKYGIRLKKTSSYFPQYVKKSDHKIYDVLFVGKDKGRGEMLLQLEDYLKSKGLKTKFLITPDGRFSRKKKYYSKEVSYDQISKWVSESKSVINITMKNQKGMTVRDLECIFNKVKLITNNNNIINFDFYSPENVFILNDENWDELPQFILEKYDDTSINLDDYSTKRMVEEITS